jgi:cytochrome c oxidase assembly protein subunit 15
MIALPRAPIATPSGAPALEGRSRGVAVWLFAVAALVYAMVVVGGATRLTGSGLSITEWKPITGALPPIGHAAWAEAFAKYRASSQYRLINQGISLAEFKVLFWWEWGHRFLARWVGVVFAVPFVAFLAARRLPARRLGRCVALLSLGGLQGFVGWWMVKSGLEGRASVAPERLATHLGLALILLSVLVWTALDAWAGEAPECDRREGDRRGGGWRLATGLLAGGVFAQCLLGALVAGNGGGLVDTDWPLMGGRIVPDDYWRGAIWATIAHGREAAQFNHRAFAYALLVVVVFAVFRAWSASGPKRPIRLGLSALLALLVGQAALGVATLLGGDPLGLALLHQANAALLLCVAVATAWRAARS